MDKEIVLITGTNSGFGLLTTIELARNGFFVIATMRNLDNKIELEKKAKELNISSNIEIVQLDVTNQQEIEDVANHILEKYRSVDILINNAGYCLGGMSELVEIKDWKRQLDTNFFGVVALTQALLPSMRKRRAGKIINLGSISGMIGFPGLAPYVSSKFALEGYSESLRLELLPFNIHVSIIEAGAYKTNIWEKSLNQKNRSDVDDYHPITNKIYDYAVNSANHAADPKEVIDTLLHICKTRKPCLRYPVGKGVKFMIFLKNILPWTWIEWFAKKKLK